MKKMTFEQKIAVVAKQQPAFPKQAPVLPIMIYVIERGCLAAGKTIPVQQGRSAGIRQPKPVFNTRLLPPEMRGTGSSDLDDAFKRAIGEITNPAKRESVLHRLVTLVSEYHALDNSLKMHFAPVELWDLDPKKKYNSTSFVSFFSPPAPGPPPPPAVPPFIEDLKPNGIPGAYKANTFFDITGKGFSLGINNNSIIISHIDDVLDGELHTTGKKKEKDIITFFPNKVYSTEGMQATVPSNLTAADDYLLRVQVTESGKTATSNKVAFKVTPNPTIVESPSITKSDASVLTGGILSISGNNIGSAKILHVGQGVKPDQKVIDVFMKCRLISKVDGKVITLSGAAVQLKSKSTLTTPGDLLVTLPENLLPGDYKLQLVASTASSGVTIDNIMFDEKGGVSSLTDLTIKPPVFRVQFTRVHCNSETSELSPTDEIQATWLWLFDASVNSRASAEHDMDAGDTVDFPLTEGSFFDGPVSKMLGVGCSLFEVDSGDTADQLAALNFISKLADIAGGLLVAAGQLIAAAIAEALSGIASAVAALISGIGNADDPLGTQQAGYLFEDLIKQTKNAARVSGSFAFEADGEYIMDYEISRLS